MGRIFISHSSSDNGAALALSQWLSAGGWEDVFLDLDPARGISAGERWERRLYEAANRCEAVLFLISRAWLSSEWCMREYDLAVKLNKRIFGLLIDDIAVTELPARVSGTWQMVNLAQGEDHRPFRTVLPSGVESHVTFSSGALRSLKAGLEKAGLDPFFFAWPPSTDPNRAPYRGMLPLEAEDAGIFFGREAPIIAALDQMRGLADAAPSRFLAILGASGSGKSSFLRAGLLPRLARDDRHFLTLPPIRPERHVLFGETGLLPALETAFRQQERTRRRAALRDAIRSGAPAVLALLAELVPAGMDAEPGATPRRRTLVVSVDQGEELFNAAGQEEAQPFLALLRELLVAAEIDIIVLMTIRSDSFERLQSEPWLSETPAIPFNLPPLQKGAYQTVIEGPARRLKDSDRPLAIDPALTSALLQDIEQGGTKDALPLLAFTLERLYLEYGGDGDLRLSEYRHLGGIKGSIEAAVERVLKAADREKAIPEDRAARLLLLRQALIPWLAGIDPDTLGPRRLVARLSEIPQEALPLVNLMIAERLLATDRSGETGEVTVEPAHEALLRQWGLLQGWLEQDLAVLSSLEALRRASRDWAANGRDAAWLVHSGGRLDDAEALLQRADIAARLEKTDHAYLSAARLAEAGRRDRELQEARRFAEAQQQIAEEQAKNAVAQQQIAVRQQQIVRRTRLGLAVAIVLAVTCAGFGVYAWQQAELAKTREDEAVRLFARASESEKAAKQSEQEARRSSLYALTNEFMRSRDLYRSNSGMSGALEEYMTSGVRLGFSLINNGRSGEAVTYLESLSRDLSAQAGRAPADDGLRFHMSLAGTALDLARCRSGDCSPADRERLQAGLNTLYGLVLVNEGYRTQWLAEIFRAAFYLVDLDIDAGRYDAAFLDAVRVEQIVSIKRIDGADYQRLRARSAGLVSWAAILNRKYDKALEYGRLVEDLITAEKLLGLTSIRLNYTHALLLTGHVNEAIMRYKSASSEDLLSDFTVIKKAGICRPEFAALTSNAVNCRS